MVIEKLFRGGMRMLIAGAVLHGLCPFASADDVLSAGYQTSNVPRSKQVQPVAGESSEGCGVAKVPGCTSAVCANGLCATGTCAANSGVPAMGGCGPQGCAPNGGWGPCGCPACRASRAKGGGQPEVDLYTFRDAGQVWTGAGRSVGSAFGWERQPQTDWNDEMNNRLCPEHGQRTCPQSRGWCAEQWALFNARNHQQAAILRAHIHGKLAYFHPMGNGGEGVPPFGCYHLVYAANPNYFDPRDGQVYAAQGWGVPMSVPLAPTVRHTMNYSNGIPSSRLTPISNVVPPHGGRSW